MLKLNADDSRLLRLLLTPSWLSGLIAVVVGLLFSVVVIVAFLMHNSAVNQQLVTLQLAQPSVAGAPGDVLPESSQATLQNSWPLLVVWGLVGVLVYALIATVMRSIVRAEGFRESLQYVHADRHTMLASTAEHVLVRAAALAALIGFAVIIWKHIIPYGVTAAYASAADPASLAGVLYALLSFGVIAFSVHILTVLLRLVFGRARIFSL